MNDIEEYLDFQIREITKYAKDSDTSLKKACLRAAPIVGQYNGVTNALSETTGRSVATIENWSHAGKLYFILAAQDRKWAKRLFKAEKLSASHWWLAYDIYTKGFNALYYLKNAYFNSESGRDMMMSFKRDVEAGAAPVMPERAKSGIYAMAAVLAKTPGELNAAQNQAIDLVLEAFNVGE